MLYMIGSKVQIFMSLFKATFYNQQHQTIADSQATVDTVVIDSSMEIAKAPLSNVAE